MEMEDQLTPTQIKIIAGWSHNELTLVNISSSIIHSTSSFIIRRIIYLSFIICRIIYLSFIIRRIINLKIILRIILIFIIHK